MATRYYLTRDAATLSPTPAGAWDDTAIITRGVLKKTKSTLTVAAALRSETNASATWDVLALQFVSEALDTAQTISGTFDLCIHCLESNADMNAVLHIHAWVTQGNSSTVRGTLLNDYIDASEFPTSTAGIQIAQQTLSSVAASVGDRIVVEVGYQAQNTLTASRSGTIRYGDNAVTDLTNGDTDTSHPAWCEFGTDVVDAETRVTWQEKWYLGAATDEHTSRPPLIRGGWTTTSSVATDGEKLLAATSAAGSSVMQLTMGGTDANRTRILGVFISPPLNAGTIPASTFTMTGLALEAAADQDLVFCIYAYLMKQNGDVRATLINLGADADADNEFPITTAAGRTCDGIAVSSQAITQEDRLVIEVGAKQLGTPAANGNATIRRGGTGADAQVGATDTAKPTWVRFAANANPRRPSPIWVGI